MENIALEQVLAAAKRLSQEEQQQLRETLDRWLRHDRPEDHLEDLLAEAGLLRARRPQGRASLHPRRSPLLRSVGNRSLRRSLRSVVK